VKPLPHLLHGNFASGFLLARDECVCAKDGVTIGIFCPDDDVTWCRLVIEGGGLMVVGLVISLFGRMGIKPGVLSWTCL